MGQARIYQDLRDFEKAYDKVNEITVEYPDFKLGKTLKLQFSMVIGSWDEFNDLCSQIVYDEPENLIALT